MAKNIINEKLVKNLMRCGGYHGDNGCDYKQTAFGNYLYAIYNVALYNAPQLTENAKQMRIDSAISKLEDIAKSCIDTDNMVIHYDEEKIEKMAERRGLSNVGALMPYVIQYVALKMGYDLAPECQDYCTKDVWEPKQSPYNPRKDDLRIVKCKPITDKQMAASVIVAVTEHNDDLIEEGKVVKGCEGSVIRENEELIKLLEDIVSPKTKSNDNTK